MAKEIDFETGNSRKFKGSVILTLTLDDNEIYIVRFASITITIARMATLNLIVKERTDGRMDGWADRHLSPMSQGHLC